jgi:hypothetical protein
MIEQRSFGKKPSLLSQMKRGEVFFDTLHAAGTRMEILERSVHMGQIARVAANIASEKSQHEGDGEAKQLVYAAYLSLGRITSRAVKELGVEEAENALTSDVTHTTLLQASKTFKSVRFDEAAKQFQNRGEWYELTDGALRWRQGIDVPLQYVGAGCPYALGNKDRAAYFSAATDEAVHTYIDAHKQDIPQTAYHRYAKLLMPK